MRFAHIYHLMMLIFAMNFALGSGRGQCDAFALTNEEKDFVSRSIANRANHAVWNDRERGALHCFFGLDTVVWRAGRLDSIFWGKNVDLPPHVGDDLCGVYVNASVWLHRGQIQLFGPATGFSSGSDWLTCNPATGWEGLEASGKAPAIRSGLCSARIDNDKILFFSEDGRLAVLNLSLQVWEDAGVLTDKFLAYFGEFSVVDLSDYILLFGELGGGLIKKSTMQLVTNYDLKFDLLRSAQSWSIELNKLSIHAGPDAVGDAEVIFDADVMYTGGASMPFSSPSPEPQEDVAGWGRVWTMVSMLLGLLFGALGSMFFIRKRSDHQKLDKGGNSSDLPVAVRTGPAVARIQYVGDEEGRSDISINPGSLEPEPSSIRSASKVDRAESRSAPALKNQTRQEATPKKRKSGLEELLQKFLDSEVEMYSAGDLNLMLGIEAEASEESQRARRARLLKQLNALHEDQTGKKLLLRERDPNDRRHLLYRINR